MSTAKGLVTPTGATIYLDGKEFTIGVDHPNFKRVVDAFKAKQFNLIPNLADLRTAVRQWLSSNKEFTLVNDVISLNGRSFPQAVTDKVLQMIDAGFPAAPLFNFLRKVRQNPSRTSEAELFLFWTANNGMIHEDGDIIAYKAIRSNYTDIHSGTKDNSVGNTVKMDRNEVDDNREVECSTGLHLASFDYAESFGRLSYGSNRLVIIKVNPANIVSIPKDYQNKKCRACEYIVVSERKNKDRLPEKLVYTDADIGIVSKTKATTAPTTIRSERRKARRKSLTDQIASQEETLSKLSKHSGAWWDVYDNITDLKNLRRKV